MEHVNNYVVLRMKDNTNEYGGWLYVSEVGLYIQFSYDIEHARLMTPEPAHSWLNKYIKNFPTLEKFDVVEVRTVKPREALREP